MIPLNVTSSGILKILTCSYSSLNQNISVSPSNNPFLVSVLQKMSQGDISGFFCKVSLSNIPDPNISNLEQSEKMASIYTHLRAFFPHFRRVYEQQSDLQPPTNTLLGLLDTVSDRSRTLARAISSLYQDLYPNQPGLELEPAGHPTKLPPPQNVFQQKVYGCVVLKTYREFLSNVMEELRKLKSSVCT